MYVYYLKGVFVVTNLENLLRGVGCFGVFFFFLRSDFPHTFSPQFRQSRLLELLFIKSSENYTLFLNTELLLPQITRKRKLSFHVYHLQLQMQIKYG